VLWSPVSWPLRQPSAHSVKFVGGVAVDNQINLEERSVESVNETTQEQTFGTV
jgi:hypothetical protein